MGTHNPYSGALVNKSKITLLSSGSTSTEHEIASLLDATKVEGNLKPTLAVSALSSGNLGTMKALSAGTYATDMRPTNLIQYGTSKTMAGVDAGYGYSANRTGSIRWKGYSRIDLQSFDILTGTVTYGAARGTFVPASGIDGQAGFAADHSANPTMLIPGELTQLVAGIRPSGMRYKARGMW